MSQQIGGYPPATTAGSPAGQPTTQVARDEATEVGRTAADAGRQVAGTAAEQAANVAQEVKTQARDLVGEARGQVQDQARAGQQKAADGIRALSQELREMADGSQQSGTVSEVARQAASGELSAGLDARLEVEATFDGGEGGWSGGTHCAIVDVDAETGIVKVERYVAVEDCGALINPAVVEGQIRGGVAQGIGAVLLERSAYGEDGSFQSATFMDYLMPTACDIPRIEIEHLETVPLDADVNFRGVGEGGMIVAPPTIVNAIEDALSPFGVRIHEQHLPPARILELIAAADPDQ